MQEHLVEQRRDLGHVQADESRVKTQGGIVWMALAMMVKTRLWLTGEVSEHRDMPLIRQLSEWVRCCAAHRPLLCCTDGFVASIRALRETLREPQRTGAQGRPRLRPWRNVCVAPGRQALCAAAGSPGRAAHRGGHQHGSRRFGVARTGTG